jgi:hypothetical protein
MCIRGYPDWVRKPGKVVGYDRAVRSPIEKGSGKEAR